ncbi:hypothetical protein ACH47Z_26245 [Streptomyces sp. NPDC020192]|uniref:hypothetical protein n=1 Tax=Streptomyces sp. NPDC020192 TaxID=3365066 RepID=UPI00379A0CF8
MSEPTSGESVRSDVAISVTLVVRGEGASSIWLLVRASFASYLATWLLDACTEHRGSTG